MLKITVLKPFTETRNGKSYKPGDVITDPFWHDTANSKKAGAYEARGFVKLEEIPDAPPEKE